MAVFRIKKNKNYTVMSNFHLGDKNLSLKAVGLLSKILSLPDDWDFSHKGLIAICKDGKDSVISALNELKKSGYLEIKQVNGNGGRFETEYLIYEKPITEKPITEKPITEKPITEKPHQLSTNKQICTSSIEEVQYEKSNGNLSSNEERLPYETTKEQKSFDKDFCLSHGEKSPSEKSHSSQNEEKTADEKIEHIENEIIEPEKTRLPEKTIDQNQDMFGSKQNTLSVVKPQKVVKAITTETLINHFHIDPQTAHDFMAVRKAKKAPLTYRALQSIEREAQKIGLTLERALNICIERNWQGFQAHWLLKERNEILQSMTPEQKAERSKKAGQYIDKVLDALIAKGTIAKDDYYKFGDIFMKKHNECFSVDEAYQTMMNAINEQKRQQKAIGA